MKKSLIFLLIITLVLSIPACSFNESIVSLKQLKDKKVGVLKESGVDILLLDLVPTAKIEIYNTVVDAVSDIREGKIDAFAYSEPFLKNIVTNNQDLIVLNELLISKDYTFAVNAGNTELVADINSILEQMKADLVYEESINRWLPKDGTDPQPANINLTGENGTLTFGTCAISEPMSFYKNGNIMGLEIELARRIASYMGKGLEIKDMSFSELGQQLADKKVDFVAASISLETDLGVPTLYSTPYYSGGVGVLTKK